MFRARYIAIIVRSMRQVSAQMLGVQLKIMVVRMIWVCGYIVAMGVEGDTVLSGVRGATKLRGFRVNRSRYFSYYGRAYVAHPRFGWEVALGTYIGGGNDSLQR